MVDGRFPVRSELDEGALRAEQLDLLPLARRDARLGSEQDDLKDCLQLVVDFPRAIGEEEIEVGRRDLRLDLALLLEQIGVGHGGIGPGHFRARAPLSAEGHVLAELHHDRDGREVRRGVPELEHQRRIVEGACGRDGALQSASAGRRDLQVGVLLAGLTKEVRETERRWRGERERDEDREHRLPPRANRAGAGRPGVDAPGAERRIAAQALRSGGPGEQEMQGDRPIAQARAVRLPGRRAAEARAPATRL